MIDVFVLYHLTHIHKNIVKILSLYCLKVKGKQTTIYKTDAIKCEPHYSAITKIKKVFNAKIIDQTKKYDNIQINLYKPRKSVKQTKIYDCLGMHNDDTCLYKSNILAWNAINTVKI